MDENPSPTRKLSPGHQPEKTLPKKGNESLSKRSAIHPAADLFPAQEER